jgi:hypothetical protein
MNKVYTLSTYALLCIFLCFCSTAVAQDFNIQHIQDDIGNAQSTDVTISNVSLIKAVAIANNNRKVSAGTPSTDAILQGDDLSGARRLTSSTNLRYHRETTSDPVNMRFNTSIWEYTGLNGGANEMIIRGRYAVSLNGTTNSATQSLNFPGYGTLSSVVHAEKCIPFITGIILDNGNTTRTADSGTAIAYLSDASTLNILKGSNAHNVTVYVTVVEFTGSNWTVLHGDSDSTGEHNGNITLYNDEDGSSGTATDVSDWSEAIIFSHHIGDTDTNGIYDSRADNWPLMTPGLDDQTVEWTFHQHHRSAGTNRHFTHVLVNPEITVTRVQNSDNNEGETIIDIASAGLSDINQAMIVGSSTSNGNNKGGYAKGWRNYYIKSTTEAAHWSHIEGSIMSHELQIVNFTAPIKGPAGLTSNLQLWLKADQGVENTFGVPAEEGEEVLNWLDNTINTNNATAATSYAPLFIQNGINFNPKLSFDGNYHEMFSTIATNSTMTIFAVAEGTHSGTNHILNLKNASGSGSLRLEQNASVSIRSRYHDGSTVSGSLESTIDSGMPFIANYDYVSGADSEFFVDGVSSGITSTNAYNLNSSITAGIGTDPTNANRRWNGGIAEMIIYNGTITDTERHKIESYLAIKYGITLGENGTSKDYVDSDGIPIWEVDTGEAEDDNFNTNVTGIGRDDLSGLNQKQSKTINTTNDITVGIKALAATNQANDNSFMANKTFLMWGHNDDDINTTTTITKDFSSEFEFTSPVTATTNLRKWKIKVTGSVPTVKISIPKSMVTSDGGPEFVMIVADDALFSTNVTSVTMELVGSNLKADFYFEGTKYIAFGSTTATTEVDLPGGRSAYFNNTGTTDTYFDAGNVNDLAGINFTISAWVKRDTGADKFDIVSKRNYAGEVIDPEDPSNYKPGFYTHGYALRINQDGQLRMVFRNPTDPNNSQLQSFKQIPENEWHHVAATYTNDMDANMAILYIDGINVYDSNQHQTDFNYPVIPFITPSDSHFLIGAAHHIKRQQRLRGSVDEVRIWNVALTENQIHYIMNQEIEENDDFAVGKILPTNTINNNVDDMPWNNLIAYYPMNTLVFGSIKDESHNRNDASMINYNTLDMQTAPLPYKTKSGGTGEWDNSATWENGEVQYLPGVISYLSEGYDTDGDNDIDDDDKLTIDYNTVLINHPVTMDNSETDLIPAYKKGNRTVLGLIVNDKLTVDGATNTNDGFGLTVTHYLKIDGTLDLEGESQLIQTTDSDFDTSSLGTLERDQQGTLNTFIYNYWSSPVSPMSNGNYKAKNYITDSDNGIFKILNFKNSGYNGTTVPLQNANYWIWKYANHTSNTYSAWQHVRSTGSISTGEGFTMKGPGLGLGEQNYQFIGQPNNGDISLTIAQNHDYLVGNPYPSAIDADKFIKDNISASNGGNIGNTINVINGTLYFWDHFSDNTHMLAEYIGGYATYTLMGGAAAINNDIEDLDPNLDPKRPERYISVGQGFYVSASLDGDLAGGENDPEIAEVNGGTIVFKNSQRVFQKETVSGNNSGSVYLRSSSNEPATTDLEPADTRQKIRLMFDSPDGYHRELLVGVDQNASNGFDLAYDGALNEINTEDMYWTIGDSGKLIIQAVNNFNEVQVLPLGLKINAQGIADIRIDDLENISSNLNVYLHDIELDFYHDLRESDYSILLNPGVYHNRFEITFRTNGDALSLDDDVKKGIDIFYYNAIEKIVLINPNQIDVKSFELFNILGQSIQTIDEISVSGYSEYDIANLSTGTYIIKLNTISGSVVTKKILVK